MSVEPGSTAPAGEQPLQGQAAPTMHDHVNSIKSKLGLDNANSPLGKLAAHTRRKLIELEAARAAGVTAPPGSPDWQAAMKPESFSKGFIRANRTQFLITASVFSLGLFWLLVIRFVHHSDNANQTGNSEVAQKALAAKQMSGAMMTQKPGSGVATLPTVSFGSPGSSFGSPDGGFGAPNQGSTLLSNPGVNAAPAQVGSGSSVVYSPYTQQPQAYQISQGYSQAGQGYGVQNGAYPASSLASPQGYAQQNVYGSYPAQSVYGQQQSSGQRPGYAQQPSGYGIQMPASNYSGSHTTALYPVRQHAASRHQVVVTR